MEQSDGLREEQIVLHSEEFLWMLSLLFLLESPGTDVNS